MFTYSKTKCIITLNLCLLRRYIADILHRGLVTTQAICYFHNNRSRGNIFTLANKTYKQYDKICFKLDYRFRLCFAHVFRNRHAWSKLSHQFFPLRFSCPLNRPNEDRFKLKSAKASILEACPNFHERPMNIDGKNIIN